MANSGGFTVALAASLVVSSSFLLMASAEDEKLLEDGVSSSVSDLSFIFIRSSPELKSYAHTWPAMEFGWRIVLGSVLGFLGAAFGTVGGMGGGGVFVPMLTLIIGFDTKSATAVSNCMIMGAATSAVVYNLKKRHPTLDMPVIDYDLALLFQPMLVLGISIGVAFNVLFSDWMVTVLLIIIFFLTSTKSFLKGVEAWKRETILKKVVVLLPSSLLRCDGIPLTIGFTMELYLYMMMEAAQRLERSDLGSINEIEYKALAEGHGNDKRKVSIIRNVNWKEVGILLAVWTAILALQIIKNYSTICSALYWAVNVLQIPVAVGASGYKAVLLYQGKSVLASRGDAGPPKFTVAQLVVYCLLGLLAGVVGGLLGLGGGLILGPLFLEMGIPPQVAGATATFAMTFSASMFVIEYYLLKRFPIPYAVYLVIVAIIGAPAGQYSMKRVNAFLGRASPIIFILAFTIFVSAVSLGGVGIAKMIYKIEHHEYMGFESLCSNDS